MADEIAAARDRLNEARRAWAEAYRARERLLLTQLARSEETMIGVDMGTSADRPHPASSELWAPAPSPASVCGPPTALTLISAPPDRRPPRSRSRQRRRARRDREHRGHRYRSPSARWEERRPSPSEYDTEAPQRRRASPSARAQRPVAPAPAAIRPRGSVAEAQGLFAKSASPTTRRPPDSATAWRQAMMQRPPGDLTPVPPRGPPPAPVEWYEEPGDWRDWEYPAEWDDAPSPELEVMPGSSTDAPPGEFHAVSGDPDAPQPSLDVDFAYEEQDIMAALEPPAPELPAGRRADHPRIRSGHYSRRDPRHQGPRLLHDGDTEICRSFNRGKCEQEEPCPYHRAHTCSTCGIPGHAAAGCSTPESDWPPKQ